MYGVPGILQIWWLSSFVRNIVRPVSLKYHFSYRARLSVNDITSAVGSHQFDITVSEVNVACLPYEKFRGHFPTGGRGRRTKHHFPNKQTSQVHCAEFGLRKELRFDLAVCLSVSRLSDRLPAR